MRVKNVSLSMPSVVGPYASIECALALRRGTPDGDQRVSSFGASDVVATSGGSDGGLFEIGLRDDRYLPFKGAGAASAWTLSLPPSLQPFDYMTIADAILHTRYTAADSSDRLGPPATQELIATLAAAATSHHALMFCLRFDFPTEWSAFIDGTGDFSVVLRRQYFPSVFRQAKRVTIDALTLHAESAGALVSSTPAGLDLGGLSTGLSGMDGAASLSLAADPRVLTRDPARQVFLLLQYAVSSS